jgi:hypothetical protein
MLTTALPCATMMLALINHITDALLATAHVLRPFAQTNSTAVKSIVPSAGFREVSKLTL